ncbi:cystatin-A5-like [Phaenicophaeus curvirostris]|uniref:cystatin-A5-like n=1 Tax=Phaenicophaeus curvirostris TaxID=33595 RepID=UPI0037F0D9F1
MSDHYADPAPATPEIQEIAKKVKPQLEKAASRTYGIFLAVLYRSQAVVGTNYLIKVEVGDEDYVHMLVYQAPPERSHGPELVQYWPGKSRDDPLEC